MRSRREVVVRNQKIALVVGFLLLTGMITGGIIFGAVRANAAQAQTSCKYYTSVCLEEGDTLWGLADRYMTEEYSGYSEYIAEVCSINHIFEDDEIHAEQYLTVPYYQTEQIH